MKSNDISMLQNADFLSRDVQIMKSAILKSQLKVAGEANRELLSLYYGIGRYVSERTRKGTWGTGVIDFISQQLQKELPGLRGFSASGIKRMRTFYEAWHGQLNRPSADDSKNQEGIIDIQEFIIRPLAVGGLDWSIFLSLSFTHHSEILAKVKALDERVFYIRRAVENRWSKDRLIEELKADLFHHQSQMPNNFIHTMPSKISALKAIGTFKDNYLLDFVNMEELDARSKEFGEFKPAYLGQLSAYLRILDSEVKKPFENPSIGIVLCKNANKAFVEFLIQGYENPMGVATYKTRDEIKRLLPSEEQLQQLLNEADDSQMR